MSAVSFEDRSFMFLEYFSCFLLLAVIPAKLQVNVSNKTPNSVRLSWENDKKYSYERGLEYNITVEPVNFKKYNLTKYNLIKYSALLKYDFILENLSYAYWPYVVRLTARVNCNTCEWNEPTEVTFNTTERIPDRAPHTYVGGFYNYGNDTTLYWEDLPDYERNGKNFTYVIQKLDMHGQKLYE